MTRGRIRARLLLAVGLLGLGAAAAAQDLPVATPGSAFVWEYYASPPGLVDPEISHFHACVDGEVACFRTDATAGVEGPPGFVTYRLPVPPLSDGAHRFTLWACRTRGDHTACALPVALDFQYHVPAAPEPARPRPALQLRIQ